MRFSLALILSSVALAGPIYSITDLGSLGGGSAQAFGLSSTGQSVGAATTPYGDVRAFSSVGSGMTDLGNGQGAAVNANGQIAGTQFINGQPYATVWDQWMGPSGSYALAINASGQVAGMSAGHAFRTVDGSLQDLGALPGGTWSSAYAINVAGQVAGYGDSGGVFRAFLWSPSTGYVLLGGANSYAMALNDAGQVAGSTQVSSGYIHAFLSSGNGIQDLGTLGGGSSYAYGIDDSGHVVGYSWLGDVTHAFLFEDGVMLDLNGVIDPASGWVLTEAYAINGSGQIVGTGMFNGVEHAFRLDPAPIPEPSAWALTLFGLLFGLGGARRARG